MNQKQYNKIMYEAEKRGFSNPLRPKNIEVTKFEKALIDVAYESGQNNIRKDIKKYFKVSIPTLKGEALQQGIAGNMYGNIRIVLWNQVIQ